jgi:putative transposase
MNKYLIPLIPEKRYHLFNHAVGDEVLFRNDDNFGFFLKKYALHTEAICDTYSYTLMPNHFHFAVKLKSIEECVAHFEKIKDTAFDFSTHNLYDFLMERFSNLCNSYTKSYNKVFERKGSLFIDYMKRIEIINDSYFCNLVNYIHFNAVHHGFCKNPIDWKWSSLHAFVANKKTRIKREDVFKKFGGFNEFRLSHAKMVKPLSEYEFL